MLKELTAVCLVLLCAFGVAYSEEARTMVSEAGSPYIGPQKADVTIIEFIDYQ